MIGIILAVVGFVAGYYVGSNPERAKANFLAVVNAVKTMFSKKVP